MGVWQPRAVVLASPGALDPCRILCVPRVEVSRHPPTYCHIPPHIASMDLPAARAAPTDPPPVPAPRIPVFPSAGATGLIAALADPIPAWAGFRYLVTALAGSCVMVVMALLYNNLVPGRRYPTYW